MSSYLLYQVKMSEEQWAEELFREIKYKTMRLSQDNAQLAVNGASILDLYKVVALIVAEDLEEAFNAGNGYPNNANTRIEKFQQAHSMSIGDVLVDIEAEKAYACCSYGWQQVNFLPPSYKA